MGFLNVSWISDISVGILDVSLLLRWPLCSLMCTSQFSSEIPLCGYTEDWFHYRYCENIYRILCCFLGTELAVRLSYISRKHCGIAAVTLLTIFSVDGYSRLCNLRSLLSFQYLLTWLALDSRSTSICFFLYSSSSQFRCNHKAVIS